jgi:tetratricopeptide (TPR) repeat protein
MNNATEWWNVTCAAIHAERWPVAEGALLRLMECHGPHPEILDLLGYALLMQGHFIRCEEVIRRAIALGTSNFWTPHKLGDALRGQQRFREAVEAYEKALAWGSDSHLTVRNLLEVLYSMDRGQALSRLETFATSAIDQGSEPGVRSPLDWHHPLPWQQGAMAAVLNTAGSELAMFLIAHGCLDPSIQRLAWQEMLLTCQLTSISGFLVAHDDRQLQAVSDRLSRLLGFGSRD